MRADTIGIPDAQAPPLRAGCRTETTMYMLAHAASRENPVQIGDSFGDACRHCGSTLIIIAPTSSSGRCAVCSPEARAWVERMKDTARRRATALHAA